MSKNIITIEPETSIQEAARIMRKYQIGSLIVVNEEDAVLGLLTEGTIIREVVAQGKSYETAVDKIMIKNPYVINPDRTLEEAAGFMRKKKVKRLPVVENDKIVGIITATDLIAYEEKLVEQLAEVFMAKGVPQISQEEGMVE